MKTISQAIKHLVFHLKGSNLQKVPALVGLTGIGKTAIAKKVANELGAELVYFNMAQLSEGEMALPVPINSRDTQTGLVKYALNHKIQEIFDHPEKEYLIFTDEFTRGTVPVISEWMTIINERQIQGHKFGDNVRFLAAMNPTTSMRDFHDTDYAATEMDDAHSNRFTFIHVEASLPDWLNWAQNEGEIHPLVVAYLKNDLFAGNFYGKEADGIRMRTPRAWEFLSDSMKDMQEQGLLDDKGFVYQVAEDQIGADIAWSFAEFVEQQWDTIKYEDIMGETELDERRIRKFAADDDSIKKLQLEAVIERIKKEAPDMSDVNVKNYLRLWETIDAVDVRYSLTYDLANKLYRVKGDEMDVNQYYEERLHFTDCPESKRYNEFIVEQLDLINQANRA